MRIIATGTATLLLLLSSAAAATQATDALRRCADEGAAERQLCEGQDVAAGAQCLAEARKKEALCKAAVPRAQGASAGGAQNGEGERKDGGNDRTVKPD